ncbi:MAG: hypothetical protein AB8H12_17025 [Lewinella sp.]
MSIFKIFSDICSFSDGYVSLVPKTKDYQSPRFYMQDVIEMLKKQGPNWNMDSVGFRMTAVEITVRDGSKKYSFCLLPYKIDVPGGDDRLEKVISQAQYAVLSCPGGLIRKKGQTEAFLDKKSLLEFVEGPDGFVSQ